MTHEDDILPLLPKALGAYYTDSQVAEFLVRWAVRSKGDVILDPSFGGGVFLRAGCKYLAALGGDLTNQVCGVEIDKAVHDRISRKISDEFRVSRRNLRLGDFFDQEPMGVDVVVGNPPFIRFHKFTGQSRTRAAARLANHGWKVSELSSSWLPFLLCSIAHLKRGGRLAMVVPGELAYASYARRAFEVLVKGFANIRLLTFREKLFADLSEDTLLLLAEDFGGGPGRFHLRDLPHGGKLNELQCFSGPGWRLLDGVDLATGNRRITEYLIPNKARDLYHELRKGALVRRLGELADVGIGYVTGANDFFHLSPDDAKLWDIPKQYLRPAVRRGRSLSGARFTPADWEHGLDNGASGYLVHLRRGDELPDGLKRYLEHGEAHGVDQTYKCRARKPWYCVPHVYRPDALLTYMSGSVPRLVANDAEAVAPNSLHVLRLHEASPVSAHQIATFWQTSLTRLSAEIEGHAMGGGMLKLEPSEAERVLVAQVGGQGAGDLTPELDALIRQGKDEESMDIVDHAMLRTSLGLSKSDCRILREAASTLRERRLARAN